MPRVARPAPARLLASAEAVRDAAITRFGAVSMGASDGSFDVLEVADAADHQPSTAMTITLQRDGDATLVDVHSHGDVDIPFFAWFFRPLVAIGRRRAVAYAVATLQADIAGGPEPSPPKPVVGLPPVSFSDRQSTLLATAAAAVAVVSFCSALFGQLADPISETFNASDATLSNALALTRVGALFALFVTALADRRGRRRAILIGLVGSAIACAVSAVAPNLVLFTFAQMFQRSFINTTAIVAGIAVIEEAPERARAYSASMLALAGGLGFSFAVVVLPLADIGSSGWRMPFVIGALSVLLAPRIARNLAETTRYETIAARTDIARGRFRELFDSHYGRRFVLLAIIGFLANVFSAPSSQLMNKYLSDDRGFSNSGIAGFRAVTTAIPGLIGLLVGGRLAERIGRRPVAVVALLIATTTQMAFFLTGGATLWVMSAVSVLTSAAAGIALGTLDVELFPTEVRGTSNAVLLVVTVVGSMTGFALAGALSDPLGGIGRSIALCGIATLIAAIFFVPRLPETHLRTLDDVSPSEPGGEYGPDRAID
jgi:MFS family permease